MLTFKELPIASTFKFSEQVGFNLGRRFIKISQRCYVQMIRPGMVSAERYQVGTIFVNVEKV